MVFLKAANIIPSCGITMKRNLVFLLFLSGSVLLLSQCKDQDKNQAAAVMEAPPIPVNYIVAAEQNVPIWLEYTGKTEATRRIEVRARVSGRLEKVHFAEGDLVEEGQQLFTIEKTSYQAEVDKAKAT